MASEIGVPLKDGYNGDLTSKQNGSVGGYMVKKMIEAQEKQMAGSNPPVADIPRKRKIPKEKTGPALAPVPFLCEIISSSDSVHA